MSDTRELVIGNWFILSILVLISMFEIAGIQSAFTVRSPVPGTTSGEFRFSETITDVGGAYDTSTGVFTCEHPGVYVFHLHISVLAGFTTATCSIRKNGGAAIVRADSLNSFGHGNFASSNTLTVHLNRGDTIDVAFCEHPDGTGFHKYLVTTFSGYLVSPDA